MSFFWEKISFIWFDYQTNLWISTKCKNIKSSQNFKLKTIYNFDFEKSENSYKNSNRYKFAHEWLALLKKANFTIYNPTHQIYLHVKPGEFQNKEDLFNKIISLCPKGEKYCKINFSRLIKASEPKLFDSNTKTPLKSYRGWKVKKTREFSSTHLQEKVWIDRCSYADFSLRLKNWSEKFREFITKFPFWENQKYTIKDFHIEPCENPDDLIYQLGKKANFDFENFSQKDFNLCKRRLRESVKKQKNLLFFDGWSAQNFAQPFQTNSDKLYEILQKGNFTLYKDQGLFFPVPPDSAFAWIPGEGKKRSRYLKDVVESCISLSEESEIYKKKSELYIHGFSNLIRSNHSSYRGWKMKEGIFTSLKQISYKQKKEISEPFWLPLNEENQISCMQFFHDWLKKYTTPEYLQLWNDNFNLECKIVPLPKKEKKKEISAFNKMNKKELFHFFKNSSSIYHRLCYFFSMYPINNYMSNIEGHQFERHHIICIYIHKNHVSLPNLEKNYNKISLSYLLHKIIHLVRYIEFQYEEDLLAFWIAADKQKRAFVEKNISKILSQCLQTALFYTENNETIANKFSNWGYKKK